MFLYPFDLKEDTGKIRIDWLVHLIFLGVLTFLIYSYLDLNNQKVLKILGNKKKIPIYLMTYGLIIELIQEYLIPRRYFDLNDLVYDGLGVIMGVVLFKIFWIK